LASVGQGLNGTVTKDIPAGAILDLVAQFCAYRGVATWTRLTVVSNLDDAVRIVGRKGPDRRWLKINTRGDAADVPSTSEPIMATLERHLLARAVSVEQHRSLPVGRPSLPAPWYLRPTVASSAHFARSSLAIGRARALGLGWMLPANGEVLIVAMPIVRLAEGISDVLHDDTGRPAVMWLNGTSDYYLQGAWFTPISIVV
jgi:hypothetical protein